MSTDKPRRLGRGLEALLAGHPATSEPKNGREEKPRSALRSIALSQIRPNPMQPRKQFSDAELRDLEASIRSNGLLQPVTVRAAASGHEFFLIAGERRFRAVQRLGWREVPAIVRDESEVDDKSLLTLALVENLQRSDLNPIEEGEGYQQLIAQFSLSQQEVADVVGKDRSTVANTVRLLALPSQVRRMVREGELSIGHARALLSLGDDHRMIELAKAIVAEGLNVREVERRVREAGTKRAKARHATARPEATRPPEVARIEEELRRRLQTDAKVHLGAKNAGELRIPFYSADDLERLLDIVLGASREAL
ncbi:MAG: ParB/RepB/Spo0J family partition protein [Gemmatimonadales bacterium]